MPATSASLPRVSFFFSFFVAAAIDSTNEANKVPLSSLLFLDVYGWNLKFMKIIHFLSTCIRKNFFLHGWSEHMECSEVIGIKKALFLPVCISMGGHVSVCVQFVI